MASPGAAILYVDHSHHLTPLTLTYHATASRHLTSGRTDVIPPSTQVEVDSAYCPRCLTYFDAASASSGVCQKDADGGGCKDCPVCFSPVSISIDPVAQTSATSETHLVCHYLCGHCQWSSQECGIISNADKLLEYSTSADASKEKENEKRRQVIIAEASRELSMCLQQKITERNHVGDRLFRSITNMWSQTEQEEERRRRMKMSSTSGRALSNGEADSMAGNVAWSLESLERSLAEKKKELASPWFFQSKDNETKHDISSDPMAVEKIDTIFSKGRIIPNARQIAAQMILSTTTPMLRSDLFPLPVPFRARVSRRCRAELAAGRTGILVKPKLNPLEGDSSLRAGHGQWWKKDSSAVHVVPRVQICRHQADQTCHNYAILMKVRNPTLNIIRLRLSGPSFFGGDRKDEVDTLSPTISPRELENILLDPFEETFVQAHLCPPGTTSSLLPTEWLVLDHAEDPFLDIGKGREEDPPAVTKWDASSALGAFSGSNKSMMRIVATQRDKAWIELMLCIDPSDGGKNDTTNNYLAVPMAMQIEVGNGSWEASLIKRRDLPEEEIDAVTLDLVALLR